LLRDFGPAAALAQVRIARIDAKISRLDFEGRVVAAVAGVMQSYYEMQYGHGLMRVQREAVEADRSLLALARRRFELGFLPALDVSQAEVAVSTDEENLLIATNAYMDAQFRLQRAVLGAESTEAGKFRFEPTSPLGPQPLPELNRDRLVALARSQRPEVISAARAVDRENIRLRYAKNQMAPRIDLIGTFGRTGLDGDRGNSFDETFGNGGGEQWTAGVQFSIPLANLTGRAQVATVRRLQQEAELSRAQTELAAVLDVDTVLSRIETNRKRVKTAGESTRLAEEAVRIANRQFEVGKLSGFDVLEQRKRLYEARSRELRAIADFNVNLVQLAVSSGTLLDERGIALESDNVKGSVFRIP
jgi:outer membrane protein TolC